MAQRAAHHRQDRLGPADRPADRRAEAILAGSDRRRCRGAQSRGARRDPRVFGGYRARAAARSASIQGRFGLKKRRPRPRSGRSTWRMPIKPFSANVGSRRRKSSLRLATPKSGGAISTRATPSRPFSSSGAIPVVNENDTVATSEIRYGDNDRLAARVATMMTADCLVLLVRHRRALYGAARAKSQCRAA